MARMGLAAALVVGLASGAMAQSAGQSEIGRSLETTRQNLQQQTTGRDIDARFTSERIGQRTENLRLQQQLSSQPIVTPPPSPIVK